MQNILPRTSTSPLIQIGLTLLTFGEAPALLADAVDRLLHLNSFYTALVRHDSQQILKSRRSLPVPYKAA